MMPANDLQEEVAFYRERKAELLEKYEGKFVLIKGKGLLGVFDSPSAAYEEGLRRIGNVPMLIVRVAKDKPRALGLGARDVQCCQSPRIFRTISRNRSTSRSQPEAVALLTSVPL